MLSIEAEIIARLTAEMPVGTHIASASALDDVEKGRQLAPAVYVIYAGGSISQADGYDEIRIAQRWLCVVTARNARDTAARASAGTLADLVVTALAGWTPASASMPLMLSDLPDPGWLPGFQLLPLGFATEILRTLDSGA